MVTSPPLIKKREGPVSEMNPPSERAARSPVYDNLLCLAPLSKRLATRCEGLFQENWGAYGRRGEVLLIA
jgi:hypothetical protein